MFPGALGDLLLALPAWRLLRQRHPNAHLTLVVNGSLRSVAALCGVADIVERLDGPATASLFGAGPLPAWLTDRPLVYSWFGATDVDARARLAAAASDLVLARVERGNVGPHAAVAYARHVHAADAEVGLPALTRIVVPRASQPEATPLLIVHAGAGAPAKRWPLENVRAVVAWWHDRGGHSLELRGPAERDAAASGATSVTAGADLVTLARQLTTATVYLGNDAGVSHLAGAVGCRGVVVFGPTSPARWRPLGGALVPIAPPTPIPFEHAPIAAEPVIAVLAGFIHS